MVYSDNKVIYKSNMEITQQELAERFNYDPQTGTLSWSFSEKVWAAARGKAITTKDKISGYIVLTLTFAGKRKNYYAHRIIWKLVTGQNPEVIDHKNRKRADNRWCNLRNTDAKGNAGNSTPHSLFCKRWHRLQKAKLELDLL